MVMSLKCNRVPGSIPFSFIFILTIWLCSQSKDLSVVKFSRLLVPKVQLEAVSPLQRRAECSAICQVAHNSSKGNNASLHHHRTRHPGTYTYRLTYRLSARLGLHIPRYLSLRPHIHKKHWHWLIRVEHLGMVNEVPKSTPQTALSNLQTSNYCSWGL
jgi:hypothetical protein